MKLRYLICSALASAAMLFTACTPDDDSLGGIDVTAEGINFTVDVDQATNQVVFKSDMPSSYSVYWEYGPMPAEGAAASISGTSTSSTYQVGIAFQGEYYVRMAVQTRGGLVFSNRQSFTIDKLNTNLLADDTWTMLTGGVGKSKTWVLDLDKDGTSLKFGGPKWFYTAGANWNNFHDAAGGNYVDSKAWDATAAIEPSSEWYWAADWAGNGWICGAQDFGTMTFDLINGANVDVNGTKGSFGMDVDAHTITFTGTLPLSIDQSAVAAQCPSGTYKIIYITETAMQILFDGDSEAPFSYNYISKEYKDNYVAPVVTTISLPEKWESYVFPFNQLKTTYKFDEDAPYTYYDLAGNELKSGMTTFKGSSNVSDALIAFDLTDSKALKMTVTDFSGNENELTFTYTKGTLATDGEGNNVYQDAGLITLNGTLPTLAISTEADATFSSADNQLQILAYELSELSGDITDLYIGSKQYDAQGNALYYMAYHLVKQVAGGEEIRFTANIYFNNSSWGYKHNDNDANWKSENVYITGDGDYTFTFKGEESDPYLMYIDALKILKSYPNCDMVVKSIKVDGKDITFNDTDIDRGVGDEKTTFRRYILNPWQDPKVAFPDSKVFVCKESIEVVLSVKLDTGAPVVTPSE